MNATDRREEGTTPGDDGLAVTVREASLCHLLVTADGDAIAAAATLAAACDAVGTPYHVSTVRTRAELERRVATVDDDARTVAIGAENPDTHAIVDPPVSVRASEVASDLGAVPDPEPVLAGIVAAGTDPADVAPDLLNRADAEPTVGVAIPTDDFADGLAHTTLAHADFSGEREAVSAELDRLGEDPDPRAVASLLSLATVGAEGASERAAVAVERAIHPYRIEEPFATVGGYADVLSALSGRSPGLALALAMTGEGRQVALPAWRERALRTHEAIRSADTARYDGLVVACVDGPVAPVARLIRDFRAPEPVVLAASEDEAAIAAIDRDVAEVVETAAKAVSGSGLGGGRRGYARFAAAERDAFVEAVREAL